MSKSNLRTKNSKESYELVDKLPENEKVENCNQVKCLNFYLIIIAVIKMHILPFFHHQHAHRLCQEKPSFEVCKYPTC